MIISRITGGIGNQLFQYAAGRRLAHKHNTELKLDLTSFENNKLRSYSLNLFNTTASIATPEEIWRIKNLRQATGIGIEKVNPNILDYPDDVWLIGYWGMEKYFADVADIIRREFTLKNPLGTTAQHWREKILAAECSVSLHFRHGDYIYNPSHKGKRIWADIPTPDIYRNCLEVLKRHYKDITVFVFSNNLQWCRENLRLDIPTEFICGGGLLDVEELHLMSLCKHNINPLSTFSWWAAWLNQNPDKKVFRIISADTKEVETYKYSLTPIKSDSPFDSDKWIRVPFDTNKQPDVTMRPWFSLLLVVNNDVTTLPETLGTILSQDYKFFELIIIDNASYDGSNKLCQQAAKNSDKVTLIKLYDKISDGAAWNKALNIAQGDYVMFLKGNDRLVVNTLTFLYMANEHIVADIVNAAVWLREDTNGNITISGRKFIAEGDALFRNIRGNFRRQFAKAEVLKILSSNDSPVPLATKLFKRKFLVDNAIKFDEKISDADAELLFMTAAMMSTDKEMLFLPNPFYVAPKI